MVFGLVSAVFLTVRVGGSLSDYYPSKMMWIAGVIGLPAVWLGGALAFRALLLRVSPFSVKSARIFVIATSLVISLFFLATPLTTLFNRAARSDATGIWQAVASPHGPDAQVVWGATDSGISDTFVRILLDFYAPRSRQTPIAVLGVPEECDILARAEKPAVLSARAPEEVLTRYRCVHRIQVVPVQGPNLRHVAAP
jgi:hypothetical protein